MGLFDWPDSRWLFGALVCVALAALGCAYWDAERRLGAMEADGWGVVVKLDENNELDYLFLSAPAGALLSDRYVVRVGPSATTGRDSVAIYRKVN
jgi:hypothetical protein